MSKCKNLIQRKRNLMFEVHLVQLGTMVQWYYCTIVPQSEVFNNETNQ